MVTMMPRVGIFAIFCSLIAAQTFFLQLASGDSTLIELICCKSPYPKSCKHCLQSIPGSEKEDERGLGGSSIQCAKEKYPYVLQDFVDLFSNSSDNQQLTEYRTCIGYIWSSGLRLEDAYGTWEHQSNSEAADRVNAALDDYWQCAIQLSTNSVINSQQLVRDLTNFKIFMEVSIEILRQL